MSDQFRLVSADSSEWTEWISGAHHDFHHTAAHHRVWQQSGYGEGWLAVYGSSDRFVAWPYLLRPIESDVVPGMFDITAVDGYAGPLSKGCSPDDPFVAAALDRIFDCWRASRVVSAFARFHPILGNHSIFSRLAADESCLDAPVCAILPGLRHEGHTISLALVQSDAEAHGQFRESHLRHIRRAARLGVITEVVSAASGLADFLPLYYKTMTRNGAGPHYFFSRDFLSRLCDSIGPGAAAIHIARLDGRPIGAVLTTEFEGIVQYLLGGVEDDTTAISPLKLMLDHVRRWARERGNRTLHLGGGRGCQDGDPLFYFKAGFSDRRHCFYTGRWILDQRSYDRLVADRFPFTGRAPSCGFFPAYRSPDATASLGENAVLRSLIGHAPGQGKSNGN